MCIWRVGNIIHLKPSDRKDLDDRQKTACLSVTLNDVEQPGQVELAATISSRNSPERSRHGENVGRLSSEAKACGWKCVLHIYYLCYSDWDRGSYKWFCHNKKLLAILSSVASLS